MVIALAVVSSGIHLSRLYHANQVVDQDEIDYLRVATLIRNQFGIAGLWQDMLLGSGTEKPSYLEANRHPLYPSMHAFSPTFATAKSSRCWAVGRAYCDWLVERASIGVVRNSHCDCLAQSCSFASARCDAGGMRDLADIVFAVGMDHAFPANRS